MTSVGRLAMRVRRWLWCATLATIALGGPTAMTRPRAAHAAKMQKEAGGDHLRLRTRYGPVHVFRPPGYDRTTAGIVVYVHGYYVNVDQAWRKHKLARQFAASRRNALFIVPEAPQRGEDKSRWTKLRTSLIATVLRQTGFREPRGPTVVVGHSAAYRTIVPWLSEETWHNLILIDALYGNEEDFRGWLERDGANRMTLVVKGTAKWADPFVASIHDAVTVPQIPRRLSQLSRAERSARVLALASQYGHFELITDGKVMPMLLGRPPLPPITAGRRKPN